MPNIEITRWAFDAAGAIVTGSVMNVYDYNTTTPVRATVNVDADGRMNISHATEGRFDSEVVSGTQKIRFKWDTAYQVREIEVANLLVRNPAFTFKYDIVPAAITADRQLNLPLITGTDTLAALGMAQTFSAVNTYTGRIDMSAVPLRFTVGVAVAAAQYEVVRDADATNQLHFNVPTGATFEFSVNDVSRMVMGANGQVFMNDTANANNTFGLTINQLAADNHALTIKSSDVNHGVTTMLGTPAVEIDDFFVILKDPNLAAGAGGVFMVPLGPDPAGIQANFTMLSTGGQPSVTPAATGANSASLIKLSGFEHDGANALVNSAANSLIFGVSGRIAGGERSLFFVDIEGDLHVDGSTTITAFDEWDDVSLVRAFDHSRTTGLIRTKWDDYVQYNRKDLVKAGIISKTKNPSDAMVNITQLQRLHNGAIWQLGTVAMAQEERLSLVEQRQEQENLLLQVEIQRLRVLVEGRQE